MFQQGSFTAYARLVYSPLLGLTKTPNHMESQPSLGKNTVLSADNRDDH